MSPTKKDQRPTKSELQHLYEAAVRFRDLAPWEWMADADLFGVENPENGLIGYCCVLGNGGQEFGLNVFLGSEGLNGYWIMAEAGLRGDVEPVELLNQQRCLMASFEDREALSPDELSEIKSQGLKFRGRGQWPMFRSFIPGYAPWLITGEEARFLTTALQQAIEVATAFRQDPDRLPQVLPGTEVLVRRHRPAGKTPNWEEVLVVPEPPAPEPLPQEPTAQELQRARQLQKLPLVPSVVEIATRVQPEPVQEGPNDRPFFPMMGVLLDSAQGVALGFSLSRIDEAPLSLRGKVLEAIEQRGGRPAALITNNSHVWAALLPVSTEMQIPLYEAESLSMGEQFFEQMDEFGV